MLRKADLGGLSALNMKCGTTRAVSMLGRGQSGLDCNVNHNNYNQGCCTSIIDNGYSHMAQGLVEQ